MLKLKPAARVSLGLTIMWVIGAMFVTALVFGQRQPQFILFGAAIGYLLSQVTHLRTRADWLEKQIEAREASTAPADSTSLPPKAREVRPAETLQPATVAAPPAPKPAAAAAMPETP